jgi:histidinol-phosphate aminotransferase
MRTVRVLVEERVRMAGLLQQLEFVHVYPSQANFLLCRLEGMQGRDVRDRLAERGLFVRYFDTPLLRDCIRVSAGLPEHTDRLVEALKQSFDLTKRSES